MRRLAQLLKNTFAAIDRQQLPANSQEMTMHDALRICGGRVGSYERPPLTQTKSRQVNVYRYRSESDLYDQWRCLDEVSRQAGELTVVLALDEFLQSNLRQLIRRRFPAHRLVIVPQAGHWPGTDSLGDLVFASAALGWSFIEIHRDLGEALEIAISALGPSERLLLFLPTGTPAFYATR